MRRRRSDRTAVLALTALTLACAAPPLRAQTEGAPELAIPFGAAAVGAGQAVVATRSGSDAIWWNPAGLAHLTRREGVLQYLTRQDLYQVVGVTAAVPRAPVGAFALSAQMVDLATSEAADEFGNVTGLLSLRFLTGIATFATSFKPRVAAGVSLKAFQRRGDCTGFCGPRSSSALSNALDFGMQYQVTDSLPLRVGFAVRNLGLRLQQQDEEQADVIPTRLHIGVSYAPTLPTSMAGAELTTSAEVVRTRDLGEMGIRVGTELTWQRQLLLRLGYAEGAGTGGGSIGLGYVSGRLQIDLARNIGGDSEVLGGPPTLLALRLGF